MVKSHLYRTNLQVPKPPLRLELERILPTIYLKSETRIELAEDAQHFYLLHPEYSYGESIYSFAETRAIIAIEPVEIEAIALSALLRIQIPVVIFSQGGQFLGRIEPDYPSRSDILKAQITITEEQSTKIMRASCWGTLRRCRRYLQKTNREQGLEISEAIANLEQIINSVYSASQSGEVQ